MNQDKREPDLSTNVPHGEEAAPSGRSDIEHEERNVENVPIEPGGEPRESGSIERASASLEEDLPSTRRTGEPSKGSTLDRLNELLRGELASVETFELALGSVRDGELASTLRQIRDSHERRALLLRLKVSELGGEPAKSSGVWGAFARIVQRGADLLGQRAALAALEEGEEHGKKRYSRDLSTLDDATREFILTELAPEQQRTRDLARSLQRFAKAA